MEFSRGKLKQEISLFCNPGNILVNRNELELIQTFPNKTLCCIDQTQATNLNMYVYWFHIWWMQLIFSIVLMPNKETYFCTAIIRSIPHCYTRNSTTIITLKFQNSQTGFLKKADVELTEKNATTHFKTAWSIWGKRLNTT